MYFSPSRLPCAHGPVSVESGAAANLQNKINEQKKKDAPRQMWTQIKRFRRYYLESTSYVALIFFSAVDLHKMKFKIEATNPKREI